MATEHRATEEGDVPDETTAGVRESSLAEEPRLYRSYPIKYALTRACADPPGRDRGGPMSALDWNGRTYGELTEEEQAQARREAAQALQRELRENAEQIARALADEPDASL